MKLDKCIDATRISFQHPRMMSGELCYMVGSGAMHTQAAAEAVGFKSDRPKDLREPARSDAAIKFHLPQAFLGMDIALGEVEIVLVLSINVGHAIVIGNDFDRLV